MEYFENIIKEPNTLLNDSEKLKILGSLLVIFQNYKKLAASKGKIQICHFALQMASIDRIGSELISKVAEQRPTGIFSYFIKKKVCKA